MKIIPGDLKLELEMNTKVIFFFVEGNTSYL